MNFQLFLICLQKTLCKIWKLSVVSIPWSKTVVRNTCVQWSPRKSRPGSRRLISGRDCSMIIWRHPAMIIDLMSPTWRRARFSREKAATFLLQIRHFRVRATKTTRKATSARAQSRHLSVNSWLTSSLRRGNTRRLLSTRTSRKWTRSNRTST